MNQTNEGSSLIEEKEIDNSFGIYETIDME